MPPVRPWHQPQKLSIKEQACILVAVHGWHVFITPADGSKMGLLSQAENGKRWGCTNDIDVLKGYFERFPDANIGIATGIDSNIFVLEVDTLVGHNVDGVAALAKLIDQHKAWPDTLMAQSPSGSIHYYFKYEAGISNSTSALAPGIDIKGEGGMVIAPPSRRKDGQYVWLNDNAVAPAPLWLLQALAALDAPRVEYSSTYEDSEIEDYDEEYSDLPLAMRAIPNNLSTSWEIWNRTGMALFRASKGAAFNLFDEYSQRWPGGYNAVDTRARWDAYKKSPPRDLSAGTIFYMASQADPEWRDPDRTQQQLAESFLRAIKAKQLNGGGQQHSATGLILVRGSAVVMQPMNWLWEGHLLCGSQELMTGLPGVGKSQVQISLIASITAGKPWPDGTLPSRTGRVIMLTAEDHLSQTVVPRLVAAGAVLERIEFIKAIQYDQRRRQFFLAQDLGELEKLIVKLGDVLLLSLDPITAYMGGKMDSHKATEVRSQLGPLKDFSEQTNVGVSTVTHPPKASTARAIDSFIGSQAFIAACRIGHLCGAEKNDDDEETGRFLFAHAKHNTSKRKDTWAYTIEEVDLGSGIIAPKVVWDPIPVDITADGVAQAAGGFKSQSTANKVQNWLAMMLERGPVLQSEIERVADGLGFTASQLRYAREKLGVVVSKNTGRDGGWIWQPKFSSERRES